MTFDSRRLLSALTLILVIAGLGGYGLMLRQEITDFAARTDAHHTMTAELDGTLYRLRASLGYAGFINNFSHYVIRRKPRFLDAAKKQIRQADQALVEYDWLAVSNDERNALYTIRQVMNLHREMIKLAESAELKGLPAEELGQMVQVDERLAHLAMNKLAELARQRISHSEVQLAAGQRHVYQLFGWGLLGLPVLAFIGGLALGVCKRPKC